MKRLWRFLVTGDWHLHKWVTVKTVEVRNELYGQRWTRFYCRCETCGEHMKFDGNE